MINIENIQMGVHAAFAGSIERDGYVHPSNVAAELVVKFGIDDPYLQQSLEKTIFEYPAGEFRQDGALQTIENLLMPTHPESGLARVVIWTDDYSNRPASSIGDFRRRLPHEQRARFGVRFDSKDKISLLTDLVEESIEENSSGEQRHTQLIVVDDSLSVLREVPVRLQEFMQSKGIASLLPYSSVYIDSNASSHLPLRPGPTYRVSSIKHLLDVRSCFSPSERILWAIDFNGPILDRGAYIDARKQVVVERVSKHLSSRSGEGSVSIFESPSLSE